MILLFGMVYQFWKRQTTTTKNYHRPRFVHASFSNPAGNVLPYFRMEDSYKRSKNPVSSKIIREFLLQGIPNIPKEDEIWNRRFGLRETIPIDHIPDKAGFTSFTYKDMTSCKEDRTKCLPIPNLAVSSTFLSY